MHTKISLFTGITPDEYKRMMSCFHAIEKSFSADETICFFSDHPDRIGCLLEGEARPFWNISKKVMSSALHFLPCHLTAILCRWSA